MRGQFIRLYLAVIGAKHRRMAMSDPMMQNLAQLTRRVFAAADAGRRSGAPMCPAVYLAAATVFYLKSALAAETPVS
jgi:hypothetical protein